MAMIANTWVFGLGLGELFLFVFLPVLVVLTWSAWIICGKLGWPRALSLLFILGSLMLPVAIGFAFVLAWESLPRAGYSRWLMLLVLVPLANIGLFVWLALIEWKQPVLEPAA
jgi:hypothetical protein